jgi:hypothetical protein
LARSSKSKPTVGPTPAAATVTSTVETADLNAGTPVVAVNTLHSRLRLPSEKRSPTRAIAAALVVLVCGALATAWGSGAFDPPEHSQGVAAAPAVTNVSPAPLPAPARRANVLIFLPVAFNSRDYYDVRDALLADGVDIKISACDVCRPIDGGFGFQQIFPDFKLTGKLPRVTDFDALYIAGGNVAPYKNPVAGSIEIAGLIQEFAFADKPVAALGTGQGLLAIHGTLRSRSGSPNREVAKIFGNYVGRPESGRVTVDGPFITAVDDSAASEMTRTLLAEIRRRQAKSTSSP